MEMDFSKVLDVNSSAFKEEYDRLREKLKIKDEHNSVDHPSHYSDGKIEVIDYIEDKKLGFCLGNAIKYISRAGKKGSAGLTKKQKEIEDLNKAIWYIKRRIHEVECEGNE